MKKSELKQLIRQVIEESIENAVDPRLVNIAKKYLYVTDLTTRNSDSDDFYEVSVWGIRDALQAAYDLGKNAPLEEEEEMMEESMGGFYGPDNYEDDLANMKSNIANFLENYSHIKQVDVLDNDSEDYQKILHLALTPEQIDAAEQAERILASEFNDI